MDTEKETNTTPIKPYDDSTWDHWSIYDNVPFERDYKSREEDNLSLISGNIIKSYRCQIKEPYVVKH